MHDTCTHVRMHVYMHTCIHLCVFFGDRILPRSPRWPVTLSFQGCPVLPPILLSRHWYCGHSCFSHLYVDWTQVFVLMREALYQHSLFSLQPCELTDWTPGKPHVVYMHCDDTISCAEKFIKNRTLLFKNIIKNLNMCAIFFFETGSHHVALDGLELTM